ncbi:Pentatricopeptide repeat-containing protein [Apostasia shenzhenica]|uniref:Pentatricopeptide repeat-containing protein n=1 Tax=Apostasia shenzhenica TaxID=1088818 RepID=A0A2I0BFV0_9ASPA|nr:Pentatricopeptide repeat-containing protein [Apostasia shenzhenica]
MLPQVIYLTKKITEHGRNGDVAKAMELFDQMPQRNQVTWNSMLSVLINAGRLCSALQLFEEMPKKNSTSYTSLIAGLSGSGLVSEARRIFDSMPFSDVNVFSWTAMISCYAQNNDPLRALELFSNRYGDLFHSRIFPNSHTFSILLKSCASFRSLATAKQIHSLIVKLLDERGRDFIFVNNSLIDVNAKLCNLADAEMVFRQMRFKDMVTWNAMMNAYTFHLLIDKALAIFSSMREKDVLSWNIIISGSLECRRSEESLNLFVSLLRSTKETKPNSSTFSLALAACAAMANLEFGRQTHARTVKNGIFPVSIFVCNSLMTMYSSCGLIGDVERLFDEMPQRDVVSWNTAIQGFGQNGRARKALEIAEKAMASKNYNQNTFTAILTSCSYEGLVSEGLKVFDSMKRKFDVDPSLENYICVIDMLGRAGELEAAHWILRRIGLVTSSIVAWSVLLDACSVHGNEVLGRVAAERLEALEPGNARNYLGLARIYNEVGRVDEAIRVLDLMEEKELRKNSGCSWFV